MNEVILDYLKGLGVIVGWISYTVVFNIVWAKVTNKKMWNEDNPLAVIFGPTLLTAGFGLIMMVPYFVWQAIKHPPY